MYRAAPKMSVSTTASAACFLFSRAHVSTAPLIWRKLLMQAFCWAVVRAFTKLGMAIAANRPMMATTIMISTSVKPDLRDVLIFILYVFVFARRGPSKRRFDLVRSPLIAFCEPRLVQSKSGTSHPAASAPRSGRLLLGGEVRGCSGLGEHETHADRVKAALLVAVGASASVT